jgi:general secretion pathway protein C
MSATIQAKPKLPSYISLLLITILGITSAKLMWLVIAPKQQSVGQIQAVENIAIQTKEKINYGKLIANQHLFGIVEVKKAPVVETPKATDITKTAPTKLNLTLHGIVAYKTSKGGYAMISSSSGKQKVYGIGDALQDEVTISQIFSDKVVINNHGKNEDLLLPTKNAKTSNTQRSAPASFSNLPSINDQNPDTKKWDNPASIDLVTIRKEAMSNPLKLLEIASPSPAIINGQFVGYRVRSGRKRKLFRQLGFRPNDIITEVNGIILDDASKAAMMYGEISQASSLAITVKRGSQTINLPSLQF